MTLEKLVEALRSNGSYSLEIEAAEELEKMLILQSVSGHSVEQLIGLFRDGYTMQK